VSKLRHVGIRPTHPTQVLDFKRKTYLEEFPNGTYKIWTKKLLSSGCGYDYKFDEDLKRSDVKELQGCLYCPRCDEYFSKDQWEDEFRSKTSN
jgi:hypothetical protein